MARIIRFKRFRKRLNGRFIRRTGRRGFRSFTRRLKRGLNSVAEKKYMYRDVGNTSVQNAGLLINVNDIAQGSTKYTRVGNKVQSRFLKVRMSVFANTVNQTVCRFAVIRGRTYGLTVGDCPTNDAWQMFDTDKWEVIYDKLFSFFYDNSVTYTPWAKHFTLTFNLKKYSLVFNDTNTPPVTNPIYVYVWANDSVLPSPFIQGSYVYTFTDV